MAEQGFLFEALSEFPRALVAFDVRDGFHDLLERLSKVARVTGAGVSLLVSDALAFTTALDEPIATIERAQAESRRGPGIDAYHRGEPVVVVDLAGLAERWPEVVAAATEVGVHASVAIPMFVDGNAVGVLDLYDTDIREWSEQDLRATRWLAEMASAYVDLNSRLLGAEHRAAQLQRALDSRVIIEQAKGMLAADQQISPGEAFELLRRHSRNHNVPLHEVAAAVVRDGLGTRRWMNTSAGPGHGDIPPPRRRPTDGRTR